MSTTAGAMTWGDVFGCLRAMAAFVSVLFAPGYCLAWVTDLMGFRRRGAWERTVWGIALSFVSMPILCELLGKFGSLAAVMELCKVFTPVCVGLVFWEQWRRRDSPENVRASGLWIGLAWIIFVIAEVVDVGVGHHLYMSVTVFDHALRTAFVDAVMRAGVPPVNPLYWAGHGAPMRYYYFWYVLTAVAAKLAGATARQAMIASVAWAGFGLAAVVGLYCRHFLGGGVGEEKTVAGLSTAAAEGASSGRDDTSLDVRSSPLRRFSRVWVALGLLAVTGLDVLPAAAKAVMRMPTDADLGWWSPDQVSSWMGSVLWVPHHVAGLVCCLVGFLLVWMAKDCKWGQRGVCGVLAGVGFASAFGLSTWVAVAFAMVMVGWAVWVMGFERESRGRVGVLLVAGMVAVVALLPYLEELRGEASGVDVLTEASAGPAHLLRFEVRHMIDPDALLGVPGFAAMAKAHPRVEDAVAGMVLLVPGYFLELGFFGLVLVAAVRGRAKLDEAGRTTLVLAVAGLVVATFLRSTVVVNNDFGIRSILIAQFFLVMLGVMWWEGQTTATAREERKGREGYAKVAKEGRWVRGLMIAMVWIGVAGTVYQAGLLRFYLPVEDRLGRPEASGLAERAMAWRRGFDAMDGRVGEDAVVQFDPQQPGDYFRDAEIMMAGRQMASGLTTCLATFGGDPAQCAGVEDGVGLIFGGMQAKDARVECEALGVTDLVATRWDGVWRDRGGWVWGLPAVVDTGDMRIVDCGVSIK